MNHYYVKQIIIALAIFVLFTGGIKPAWSRLAPDAGKFLEIAPALIQIKKQIGEQVGEKVFLKNRGDEPLAVRIYLSPLARGSTTNFQNLAAWVSFDAGDSSFLLPPFSQKELTIKIQVPSTAKPGGYYGQIMFEPLAGAKKEGFLKIISVMAMPLLLDVLPPQGRSEQAVMLQNMELTKKSGLEIWQFFFNKILRVATAYAAPLAVSEQGPLLFKATLKNTGKFLTFANGDLIISDLKGKKITTNVFPEVSLLPAESRTLSIEAPWQEKSWFWLVFPQRLKAVIEMGGGRSELVFWVFSWKKTLTVVIIVLSLAVLFFCRRRCALACRVLFVN